MSANRSFVVLYRDDTLGPLDVPKAFVCAANNGFEAEELCTRTFFPRQVELIVETDSVGHAFSEYFRDD